MEIEIHCTSKVRRSIIGNTAEIFIKKLNLTKSKYRVIIHSVVGLRKDHLANGFTYHLGEKQLYVAVDSSMPYNTLCQTLAHEFIHVKQHAKGQLTQRVKRSGKTEFIWLGKVCKKSYFDTPWEIEAYSRESLLFNEIARRMV